MPKAIRVRVCSIVYQGIKARVLLLFCFGPPQPLNALNTDRSYFAPRFFSGLTSLSILFVLAASAVAQNIQNPQSAVDNLMRSNLHVDPTTGALQLQIPLGGPSGRGQADLPVVLRYSSKVWNVKFHASLPCSGEAVTEYQPEYAKSSIAGWTSSVGWFQPPDDISTETYDLVTQNPATQGNLRRIARKFVTLPDGSRHELRRDDTLHTVSEDLSGTYYAVDGSRIWMDASGTIFMPDGSRFQTVSGQYQHIDRNGNFIAFVGGVWKDTLNRSIPIPLPSASPTPGNLTYTLPGGISYTLHWINLSDALTDTSQTLLNKGNASPGCVSGTLPGSSLFASMDGQQKVLQGGIHNPVVLSQIILPNNTAYTFTYNVYGEINKVVYPTGGTEQFIYGIWPALGGQLDDGTYSQANRGVRTRIVSDGVTTPQSWGYGGAPLGITGVDPATVARSVIAPDNSFTVTWYYKSRGTDIKYGFDDARAGMPREERIYDSSGNMLRRTLYQVGFDGPQSGGFSTATRNARVTKKLEIILDTGGDALASATELTYDSDLNVTQTYRYDYVSVPQSGKFEDFASFTNGTLLRIDETDYLTNDQAYRDRNLLALPIATRVKDGLGHVLAQSSIAYDESQYSRLPESPNTNWSNPGANARGNVTTTSRWINLSGTTFTTFPAGTYVVTHAKYDEAGNLRKTTDANGNVSEIEYSSTFASAYPTLTKTAVPDPSSVHASIASLQTSTDYDFDTGLVTKKTDENNQITWFSYTDPLKRLKQVTKPNGAHVAYDYFDAPNDLHISVSTDLDSSRTIETRKYFDRVGRLIRTFNYDGTPSVPWIVVDTYYDLLSRPSQVSNPYRTASATSLMPATCSTCTTTTYDGLGRVRKVKTPDNAEVVREYGAVTTGTVRGVTTTVTDQALRKRRSLTDLLGRLVRVDEPNADTGNLDAGGNSTVYTYDLIGNLRRVTQGSQERFFIYDSLGRLLRSHDPEQIPGPVCSNMTDPITGHTQWSMSYAYDNNGNLSSRVDARSIIATYGYDSLNRLVTITYADGAPPANSSIISDMPRVDRYYDGASKGKGKIWYETTTAANNQLVDYRETSAYDELGNPLSLRQVFRSDFVNYNYYTSRTYNYAGLVTSQVYPSGHVVSFNYDLAGRLADKDSTNLAVAGNLGDGVARTYSRGLLYGPGGQLIEEQFGTNTAIYNKRNYNSRQQLTEILVSTSGGDSSWNRGRIVNDYGTTNNNGNLKAQSTYIPLNEQNPSSTSWSQTYNYDYLNRLTTTAELNALNQPQWQQTYIYDRFGNRSVDLGQTSQLAGVGSRVQTTISSSSNRLYAPGETDQSHSLIDYDSAGNQIKDYYLTADSNFDRTYDAENHMKKSTLSYSGGSVVSSYSYDASGQRVRRTIGSEETWQVYGFDGELLAEYRAKATSFIPSKEYAYRNHELLLSLASGDDLRLSRFVYNLYYGVLQRDATSQEVADATNQLAAAGVQGQTQLQQKAAEIARALFVQTNYESTKTDLQFVADLYYAYLHRAPDDSGLAYWSTNGGAGGPINRQNILNAFEASGEFQTLVGTLFGSASSDNQRTDHFINNLYLAATGVNATSTQLQQQRDRLNNAADIDLTHVRSEAEAMGRELVASQVTNLSITETQFVTNLYEAFLQRGPDASGLGFWASQAGTNNPTLRQNVLNAFAVSGPFRELSGALYREVFWQITDHLGTPRMLITKTGSLFGLKRHDYLPFGEELSANIGGRTNSQGYVGFNGVRQQFTSKERDGESGLDYFGARFYNNAMGRFTSCDPKPLGLKQLINPQRWNRYAYVINNPLALYDPDGQDDQGKGGGKVIDIFLAPADKDDAMSPRQRAELQKLTEEARQKNIVVNVYEGANNTGAAVVQSLETPGRIVIMAPHSSRDMDGNTIGMATGDGSIARAGILTHMNGNPDAPMESTPTNDPYRASLVVALGCDSAVVRGAFQGVGNFIGVNGGADHDSSTYGLNAAVISTVRALVNSNGNTDQATLNKVVERAQVANVTNTQAQGSTLAKDDRLVLNPAVIPPQPYDRFPLRPQN
ncbi:MAG TPA: DUF4214 domain-containing protein [Pyrinomonadaceae bacterium]